MVDGWYTFHVRMRGLVCGFGLGWSVVGMSGLRAQVVPWQTTSAPAIDAAPLPEDRGADGLAQTLRKLRTWGSLMMIVAHPDDEDGGMMAYESRGEGIRTSLLTLTRGEGGQNALGPEVYDALGLIRTNELLLADRYSGTEQLWGTEADYGFSKTKEEAFAQWGRDRVLRDVVRAVRQERPLVLCSVFVGGITDGHGHHQVSGELAQEAYNAAGDPKLFPELGPPWKPFAVFSREPFAAVTAKGVYDYATDSWGPAVFTDYVTGARVEGVPTADITIPEGQRDPILGRSYIQMAREGWGLQKSQNGGGNPPLAGPDTVGYHRWAAREPAPAGTNSFFAGIDTSLPGLASLAPGAGAFLTDGLQAMDRASADAMDRYSPSAPQAILPALVNGARATADLLARLEASSLPASAKAALRHELAIKQVQWNTALVEALGLRIDALLAPAPAPGKGHTLDILPELTRRAVVPGETFDVRLRLTAAEPWGGDQLRLVKTEIKTPAGENWQTARIDSVGLGKQQSDAGELLFRLTVPRGESPTAPYFSRPFIEQAFYDVSDPKLAGRSLTPYPVSAHAEWEYAGVPIRLDEVVQAVQRERGPGTFQTPLTVVPGLSVNLPEQVAVLPTGKRTLTVEVSVENDNPDQTEASLRLNLPSGWAAQPANAALSLAPGERAAERFLLTAPAGLSAPATIKAIARAGNFEYSSGFERVGYPGLRPAALYRAAAVEVKPVQVQVAPGARVAYVPGTGDPQTPAALRALGVPVDVLTPSDLLTVDLHPYSAVLLGVRTYTASPGLADAAAPLRRYAEAGGTVIFEYQSGDFPAPFPLRLGSNPAKVVEESRPVSILAPAAPLLTTPNRITEADFAGWVEERGHGFAASWGREWTLLLQMADVGQPPQQGGLLVAPEGKGRYVYLALALYRQLPEGVPGAYRLLANLVSGGR